VHEYRRTYADQPQRTDHRFVANEKTQEWCPQSNLSLAAVVRPAHLPLTLSATIALAPVPAVDQTVTVEPDALRHVVR
jgi:hypothetical protein